MEKKIIGKATGKTDIRHLDCGGALMIDGSGFIEMPFGLGFRDGSFCIDKTKHAIWSGCCLKCGADGYFVNVDKKATLKTYKPKKYQPKKVRA